MKLEIYRRELNEYNMIGTCGYVVNAKRPTTAVKRFTKAVKESNKLNEAEKARIIEFVEDEKAFVEMFDGETHMGETNEYSLDLEEIEDGYWYVSVSASIEKENQERETIEAPSVETPSNEEKKEVEQKRKQGEQKMEVKIFLTNLGKYNEGELVGKWVEMPIDEDELEEVLESIGIDEEYEEFFITDYEAPFKICEYDSIESINKKIEAYENALEEVYDEDALQALLDEGYSLDEIAGYDYRIHYDVNDMSDIAYNYVNECYNVDELPLGNYIDYEALGRDMEIEGTYIFYVDDEGNNCAIEILN